MLFVQQRRRFLGEIGQDHVRDRAFDRDELFHHCPLTVDPAEFVRGLDHGKFTADVIGGHGQVELLFYLIDDVQIGKSGLHHHDVRSFIDIKGYFSECFAAVRWVHLV